MKLGIGILLAFYVLTMSGQTCEELTQSKREALVDYFRKQYRIDDKQEVKLSKDHLIAGSCYRSLTFEGKSPVKTWELTMFLSPDQRFLSEGLLDLRVDPVEEQRKQADKLMTGLSKNKGASKGNANAPVTLVEFSDFQCPFCSRFSQILSEVLRSEKDDVRVVFHHMPLSIHSWARAAAEGAACAQMQSSEAFWSFHDELFRQQREITSDNIKSKLKEFAAKTANLNQKEFDACVENETSLGLVFQDADLASTHQVNATPTIFINGERADGVRDANDLRRLIEKALNEKGRSAKLDVLNTPR